MALELTNVRKVTTMKQKELYKLIAATDVQTFNQLMNEALEDGYDIEGQLVVTPHRDSTGYGMQYSQGMLRNEA